MIYQRPAYEQVTIAHGGNTVTLRPTLRAAAILEQRHGFPTLFRALDDFNFTIICEIIGATCARRADAAAFLTDLPGRPLLPLFLDVHQPLAELVSMFMPTPDPKQKPSAGKGKLTPWADYYRDLYGFATGWLGWTPEQAWNATPTEIDRAYSAHVEMLKAIHGSTDEKPAYDPLEEVSQEEVREGITRLKATARRGKRC
jgi:hypothetical protein